MDVAADVVGSELSVHAAAEEHGADVVVDAGEDDGDAFAARESAEALQVVQAGGVHEGHLTHTDDANGGLAAGDLLHTLVELVGDAEEEGAVDLVDLYATRHVEVLVVVVDLALVREVDVVRGDGDARGLGDASHEEHHGQQQADLDGDGEVEDDGQEEGGEQHGDVAPRVLQQRAEGAPLAHVVGHDDEHTGQTGHRYVARQGAEEEQDEQ